MGLLFKYLFRDFLAKRTMVSILSLIIVFTSFMYFFVHFAIDANLLRLGGEQLSGNEANYFTALKSTLNQKHYCRHGSHLLPNFILIHQRDASKKSSAASPADVPWLFFLQCAGNL